MIFSFRKKIYGYECDVYGHLNNANYLQVFEAARSEVLKDIGLSIATLKKYNISIYLIKIELEYKKSVELEDTVTIRSKIVQNNRIKALWKQELYNGREELCSTAIISGVYVSNGKPTRIDKELCARVDSFLESD